MKLTAALTLAAVVAASPAVADQNLAAKAKVFNQISPEMQYTFAVTNLRMLSYCDQAGYLADNMAEIMQVGAENMMMISSADLSADQRNEIIDSTVDGVDLFVQGLVGDHKKFARRCSEAMYRGAMMYTAMRQLLMEAEQ